MYMCVFEREMQLNLLSAVAAEELVGSIGSPTPQYARQN